jgi:hypothetical protein
MRALFLSRHHKRVYSTIHLSRAVANVVDPYLYCSGCLPKGAPKLLWRVKIIIKAILHHAACSNYDGETRAGSKPAACVDATPLMLTDRVQVLHQPTSESTSACTCTKLFEKGT